VIGPNARIVSALKQRHPGVPVIGFPKVRGAKLRLMRSETGVDALGIDETQDPRWIAGALPTICPSRAISTARR
jgi:uroporphyrinogen decarboxylase